MSITSYAQNFEDVMLWRALSHVDHGFYIDIGAQDAVIDSVSLAFYEQGWRGIHVEPLQRYAESLRQQRPGDMVIQAAVGEGPAVLRFFEIPGSGISTADSVIAGQHRSRGFEISEIAVPCIPLSTVLDAASTKEVHWLKIDVEGFERQVLASWGLSATKPWILVIESTVPLTQIDVHREWERLVIERGYSGVYFDGLNHYYLSDEHPELKAAFQVPPNIFDDFALNGTASAPFHRRIDARYREQIGELLAQAEAQQRLQESDVDRLKQSIDSQTAAHADREHKLLERITQAQHEAQVIQEVLGKRQREFTEQLLLNQQIAALEQAEQEGLLEAARRELESTSASLREKEQALSRHEIARATMQREFEIERHALRDVGNRQARAIDRFRSELAAVHGSLSWRATASFRFVGRVLRSALTRGRAVADLGGPNSGMGYMIDEGGFQRVSRVAAGPAADLRSILQLQDAAFVRCAYWTVLRREPDADGVRHYVRRIRTGTRKMAILASLYASGEAKKMGVDIPWLRKAIRHHRLARLPIVGSVMWSFLLRGNLSEMDRRMIVLEETVNCLTRESDRRGGNGEEAANWGRLFDHGIEGQSQLADIAEVEQLELSEMSKVAREIFVELSEAVEDAQGRATLKRTKRDPAIRGY